MSNSSFDKLTFLENWHYRERDRKDVLNNNIQFPASLLILFITAGGYLLKSVTNIIATNNSCLIIFYSILLFFLFFLLIKTSIYLYKAYNNFHKTHTFTELDDNEILNKPRTDYELQDYLIESYTYLLTNNIPVHDQIAENIAKAKTWLLYSLVGLVICFIYLYLTLILI